MAVIALQARQTSLEDYGILVREGEGYALAGSAVSAPSRRSSFSNEAGGRPPLFIVTGRRSLVANLRLCLRRLHGAAG